MRTELTTAALLLGCASTSIDSDVAHVSELGRAPLPALRTPEVDQETTAEVRALLREQLTPDSAVRIAILNNRELRATLRDLGVERGQLVQAGLLPNPSFEFDLRRSTERDQPLQIDLFVEIDLTHMLLTPMRSDIARSDLDAARYRAASAVVATGQRVRGAVFSLQAAEQRRVIGVRALDALSASRDAARALFEAGNIPELDLATEEVAYESARAQVAELELDMLDRREELQTLLGLYGEDTHWKLAGPLPPPPEDLAVAGDVEKGAIENSLLLREIKSRLEAMGQRTALARAQGWIPEITIDAHAEQDSENWEVGGGATITLPIFDRQQGTVRSFEAQFDALSERYVGAAIAVRSAARSARNRLQSAHKRARQYAAVILPARARVMQQTLLQYNAMQIGVFQLLEARRQQLDSELDYVGALEDLWTARAALDAILTGYVGTREGARAAVRFAGGDAGGGH